MRAGAPHGGSPQRAAPLSGPHPSGRPTGQQRSPTPTPSREPHRQHPACSSIPPLPPLGPPSNVFRHAVTLALPCSLCNGMLPARPGRILPCGRREGFTRIPNHSSGSAAKSERSAALSGVALRFSFPCWAGAAAWSPCRGAVGGGREAGGISATLSPGDQIAVVIILPETKIQRRTGWTESGGLDGEHSCAGEQKHG